MGPLAPKLGIVCTPFHYAFGSFRAISMYGFRIPTGGKGWGPLPRPQHCDSGHIVLQQNASFADDFCRAAHGDPRSKIVFLGSGTTLVPIVTQISAIFSCVFDILGAHEVLVLVKP
jgi:hypothetical protein